MSHRSDVNPGALRSGAQAAWYPVRQGPRRETPSLDAAVRSEVARGRSCRGPRRVAASRLPPHAVRSRGAATMERALIVVAEILDEGGEASLRLADVSRRSGVSIGSLYHHFESREGLIRAARERQFLQSLPTDADDVADLLATATSPERVRRAARSVMIREHPDARARREPAAPRRADRGGRGATRAARVDQRDPDHGPRRRRGARRRVPGAGLAPRGHRAAGAVAVRPGRRARAGPRRPRPARRRRRRLGAPDPRGPRRPARRGPSTRA